MASSICSLLVSSHTLQKSRLCATVSIVKTIFIIKVLELRRSSVWRAKNWRPNALRYGKAEKFRNEVLPHRTLCFAVMSHKPKLHLDLEHSGQRKYMLLTQMAIIIYLSDAIPLPHNWCTLFVVIMTNLLLLLQSFILAWVFMRSLLKTF